MQKVFIQLLDHVIHNQYTWLMVMHISKSNFITEDAPGLALVREGERGVNGFFSNGLLRSFNTKVL